MTVTKQKTRTASHCHECSAWNRTPNYQGSFYRIEFGQLPSIFLCYSCTSDLLGAAAEALDRQLEPEYDDGFRG